MDPQQARKDRLRSFWEALGFYFGHLLLGAPFRVISIAAGGAAWLDFLWSTAIGARVVGFLATGLGLYGRIGVGSSAAAEEQGTWERILQWPLLLPAGIAVTLFAFLRSVWADYRKADSDRQRLDAERNRDEVEIVAWQGMHVFPLDRDPGTQAYSVNLLPSLFRVGTLFVVPGLEFINRSRRDKAVCEIELDVPWIVPQRGQASFRIVREDPQTADALQSALIAMGLKAPGSSPPTNYVRLEAEGALERMTLAFLVPHGAGDDLQARINTCGARLHIVDKLSEDKPHAELAMPGRTILRWKSKAGPLVRE